MLSIGTRFYDRIMRSIENACLKKWRKELLKDVHGRLLEIGAGTGASLNHYPDKRSLKLYFSEPDKNMRKILERKILKSGKKITLTECIAESLDYSDEYFDYVFTSLVFCSIKDVNAALLEIKRVLKPKGKIIFIEHVAAEKKSRIRKLQDAATPFWRVAAGNCHLNRDTEKSIKDAGFRIITIKHDSMNSIFPLVRPSIRGIGEKKWITKSKKLK